MTSTELTLIVFMLLLVYDVIFRIKIKCPECGKDLKTVTYKQLGISWLLIAGSGVVYDLFAGESINYYLEMLFMTPAFYYLSSEPKVYCRHCMKGIPFNKEDVIS